MKASNRSVNLRYFMLQALFWGAAVVNFAYMTPLLEFKEFSEVEIGILNGVKLLVGVFFQIWIGVFADRKMYTVPLKNLIGILSAVSCVLTFALLVVGHNVVVMLLISMGFGIAFTTISPLVDSLSMIYVNHGEEVSYAKGRAGGSISWAFLCVFAGIYSDRIGIETLPVWGIVFLLLLMAVAMTMPWSAIQREQFIVQEKDKEMIAPHSVKELLRQYSTFTIFLVGSAVMFMGYNFGNTFLIDIFTGLGGNHTHYGISQFVLAISEVPSAFLIIKSKGRIPIKWCMFCCAIFMTVKNLIPTYTSSIEIVIAAQACEMLGFGLYYAGSIYLIEELLPEVDVVKATTLMSVATIGLGEGIAAVLCGIIRSHIGLYGLMKVATFTNGIAILILFGMCRMGEKQRKG